MNNKTETKYEIERIYLGNISHEKLISNIISSSINNEKTLKNSGFSDIISIGEAVEEVTIL